MGLRTQHLTISRFQVLLACALIIIPLLPACSGKLGGGRMEGQGRSDPLTLRILSYNIHHGQGTDGIFDLERLARVISSVEPDLVALQEVDRATTRSGGVDQAAELARLTGMEAAFGKTIHL